MHSTQWASHYDGGSRIVLFHHNSDYSGVVTIESYFLSAEGERRDEQEITVDMEALERLVGHKCQSEVVSRIEQQTGEEFLRSLRV